ncbi:MAG TPA: flagellar basal body P-ring protein FlgI [Phycisphaerae bacterium]|nr:flagellar basal body P-ring protein FlgI [Phycisphaerae bacterium]HNU45749.1 flagellar basal body P-ring protein FlgI [Phycisphaerae bacterium]
MSTSRRRRYLGVVPLLAWLCLSPGACSHTWKAEDTKRRDLGVDAKPSGLEASAAYRDTIGSVAYYDGLRTLSVRGFGLVVGLGRDGSADCPKPIYDQLVQKLYKRHDFSTTVVGERNVTPEQLIRDRDTAVVLVRGEIPPGATAGTAFDVWVSAIPGTQTRSLYGARLYSTELETFRTVGPQTTLSGKVMGEASGLVFLNPFAEGEATTQTTALEGAVLSGGRVWYDREIRLVLLQPSYALARRVQDRINDQFAHLADYRRVADAISPSYVRLRVPEAYREDTAHFLGLVRCLCLNQDATFAATRARELGQELVRPDARHADLALCLEGLGRAAVPMLDELYAHPQEHVSFHAAAAGLRLGENLAVETMVAHAQNPANTFRFQAIRALGFTPHLAVAKITLRRLLDDPDPRVQAGAYETLLKTNDVTVQTRIIGVDNFALDLVPTRQRPFIYARRSEERRLALFGAGGLACEPPLFYRAPNGVITMTAAAGDDHVSLLRMVPVDGTMSPPIPGPLDVAALVTLLGSDPLAQRQEVLGVGLDYGTIVRLLYHLCQDQSIPAEFMLEQPNALELFGPTLPAGRPESEL